MLVWVASYPRSGNTLTTLVLRDVFGIREIGRIVTPELDLGMVPKQAPTDDDYERPSELRGLRGSALVDALRERPEPYFIKTHRLGHSRDPAPALYVVRDGRDANVSYAHLIGAKRLPPPPEERLEPGLRVPYRTEYRYRRLPLNQRLVKLISRGVPPYGHWSRSVNRWRQRGAPVALVQFESLVENPIATVRRACEEIRVDLPEPHGEVASFASLQAHDATFFRRGEVGAWRDELSPRLQGLFWKLHGETMRELGYGHL